MSTQNLPPTRTLSPEEMERQIVRFKDLKPQSSYYSKDAGIPDEAYRMVSARSSRTLSPGPARPGRGTAIASASTIACTRKCAYSAS
jgi:hypothetical protein